MGSKLLVVDSDPKIHQWAETNLPSKGFEVTCYHDGLSALDMLSSIDPDVVLADYNLAGLNIFKFCTKLQQKSASKARPTFILVQPEAEKDQARLDALGEVGLIEKPLDLEAVLQKIGLPPDSVGSTPSESPAMDSTATISDPSDPSGELPSQVPEPSVSEESAEDLKLEELLGWSIPSDRKGDSAVLGEGEEVLSNEIKEEDERTIVMNPNELASSMEAAPHSQEEPSALDLAQDSAEVKDSDSDEPTLIMSLADAMHGPDKLETPQELVVPDNPPSTLESQEPQAMESDSTASKEAIEATLSAAAREIIEKIAWEVVPSIAEALIKEELEKIKSETPN